MSALLNVAPQFVSLREFREMVQTFGPHITLLGKGEPGMGKSSQLAAIAEANGDKWRETGDYYPEDKYRYLYIDCTNEEINDRKMNMPRHDSRSIVTYLSEEFHMDDGRPLYILIDEFTKGPRALQTTWLRLMLNRVIGDRRLPDGSVVFALSNHTSDGVGDKIEAHAGNRLMIVPIRKSTALEYLAYIGDRIPGVLRSWIGANKRCFASYLDAGQSDNELIFNPTRRGEVSFCSNRSITAAGRVIEQRGLFKDHVLEAALAGLVGKAAAKSIMATIAIDSQLASFEEVIADPTGIAVPEDPVAQILMMVRGADSVETQDQLTAFMQFVDRIQSQEVQQLFFAQVVAQARTVALVRGNQRMTKWRIDNWEYMA